MRKYHDLKMMHIVSICIGIFFVISASIIVFLVNYSMRQESLREAESKARILLDRNLATHMYFSQILKPRFFEWTAPIHSKGYFDPSWMSSIYANREIQKYFQSFNSFGYYVKDAAIDARNSENEADAYEKGFIEKFRADKTLESHSDVHIINGRPYLVILRRGEIIEGSCLQCHSEPEVAPKELLKRYGTARAFHRKTGDLASVISIRIPLADAYAGVSNTSMQLSIILVIGLIILLGTQFFLYRRFLITPIGVIRDKALELAGSEEHLGDTIPRLGSRELNELSDAFNKMSTKLRIGREQLEDQVTKRTFELHSANEALQKEIDERRQMEEALKKNRMDLIAIIDNLPFLAWMKDSEGRFVAVNEMFARSCGSSSTNDLVGKTDLDIWPKHLAEAYRADDFEVMRTGQKKAVEELVADQGVDKWFETYKAPLYDVNGNVAGTTGFARDITESKEAEQALRSSEERFKLAMQAAQEGIWDWNMETNAVYYSPKWKQMLGYREDEIEPHVSAWNRLLHPDDVAHAYQVIEAVMRGERKYEIEFRLQHKEGYYMDILSRGFPVRLEPDGPIVRIVGTHLDLTERKQAEAALRNSEKAARELAQENELIAEIGRIIGSTLNIEEVYERFAEKVREAVPFDRISISHINLKDYTRITGYNKTDGLSGNRIGEVLPLAGSVTEYIMHTKSSLFINSGNREEMIRNFPSLTASPTAVGLGARSTMMIPLISKDEAIGILAFHSFKINAYSEKDLLLAERVGTQIAGAIANAQLFLERKQAEEALHRSEENFRRSLDDSPLGVRIVSIEGDPLYVNRAFLDIHGYDSIEGFRVTAAENRLTPESFEELRIRREKIKHGVYIPSPYEMNIVRKDGEVRHLQVFRKEIIWNGEIQFQLIYLDITDRKRADEEKAKLQEQLLQSQKMESIGRLAGGVAHDFNNMLGVILGHLELAIDKVDKDQSLLTDLKEIRNAAERSSNLTRQLLAFARRQTVSPVVLGLNETIDGMLKLLRRLIGENNHLAWLPGVNLWPVKIDPSQIDQILANLCVNASDAITGVGKITVETGNITLDEGYCAKHKGVVPGEYVLLAVSDNGCGMDKEVLSRLFEPFFTTKGVGKGTGLGLATVYGIVKQNDGFIDVYSEPGQGTTFKIYLPRHQGKAEQPGKEKLWEPTTGGHETVLLVEDEPALLELSKLLLETQGYRVLAAGTPNEAIRLAEEYAERIHLLMTDVVMPEMNGQDLAKIMLSRHPHLKCLFTSGYTADVIAQHGVLDEGVYFIQKPFSRKELAAKVREVLAQK